MFKVFSITIIFLINTILLLNTSYSFDSIKYFDSYKLSPTGKIIFQNNINPEDINNRKYYYKVNYTITPEDFSIRIDHKW